MKDHSDRTLLGNFDLKDAKSICTLLESKQIDFEVEIDDQPIRNLSPWQAAYGGTYGSGTSANIYVHAQSIDPCIALLNSDK